MHGSGELTCQTASFVINSAGLFEKSLTECQLPGPVHLKVQLVCDTRGIVIMGTIVNGMSSETVEIPRCVLVPMHLQVCISMQHAIGEGKADMLAFIPSLSPLGPHCRNENPSGFMMGYSIARLTVCRVP